MRKYFTLTTLFLASCYLSAQSVVIKDGTIASIGPGITLSIGNASSSGTLSTDNSNCLVLESTSSGTASLICGGTASVTVNRYTTSDEWHLVSPPTSSATVNNYYFNNINSSWITYFNESSGTNGDWAYMTDLTEAVNPYQGYSFFVESVDQTLEYQGSLSSGDIQLTTSTTPALSYSDAAHGYNLIGNPYPCALNFDGNWNSTNVDNNIWVWDESYGNYLAYIPDGDLGTLSDGIIPMGQGFFIHANGSNPEITIPASARVHSTQSFYKSRKAKKNSIPNISIEFENNAKKDIVFFGFSSDASTGFDSGYDARKLFGSEDSPQAYFYDGSLKLSIDVHPEINGESLSIPIKYTAGSNGDLMLKAIRTNLENVEIELEDKLLGIYYDLNKDQLLSLSTDKSDDPGRFVLHFNRNAAGIENPSKSAALQVYSYKNVVYINQFDKENKKLKVKIRDIVGRKIYEHTFEGINHIEIPVNTINGYYIVSAMISNTVINKKVFISNQK